MVFPVICSLYYKEDDLYALAITGIITIGLGLPLWWLFRRSHQLNLKDGYFIAVFGWVLISAMSGLPFMLHGSIPAFTDAFFEMNKNRYLLLAANEITALKRQQQDMRMNAMRALMAEEELVRLRGVGKSFPP